ncbi:hypothetical protein ACR9YC_00785 [Parasphingorhabdus sp. DH2-15]
MAWKNTGRVLVLRNAMAVLAGHYSPEVKGGSAKTAIMLRPNGV